ncbi:hypothetical protein Pth03_33470 [Planotetraspora thailandica]|uniref:Uncharacterized protein n=1 Tax=Planotetraspora thailandica TaxID=487172 RepID=A0A8J3UZZ7_9ACTN|nr:hypothetical protein [Planotetraspora thailandica]GII54958.1 hypothetical protein Pth03_33470 [Planotetraspora thailandica]
MDVIAVLEWLLERDVNALLRAGAQRGGTRTWTFHATGGHGDGKWWVRTDADSAEECVRGAREQLRAHGIDLPEQVSCDEPLREA